MYTIMYTIIKLFFKKKLDILYIYLTFYFLSNGYLKRLKFNT